MNKIKVALSYLKAIPAFLGPGLKKFLILGFLASIALGLVEVGIGFFTQAFLKSLNILNVEVNLWGLSVVTDLTPWNVAVALLALASMRSLAQYLVLSSSYRIFAISTYQMRCLTAYDNLVRNGGRFIPSSKIGTQLSEIFPQASLFSFEMMNAAGSILQGLILCVAMCLYLFRESLVAVTGIVLVAFIVITFHRAIRRQAYGLPKQQKLLLEGVERVARNWLLVRILRTNRSEFRNLTDSADSYSKHYLKMTNLHSIMASTTPFMGIFLVMAIVVVSHRMFETPGIKILSLLYLMLRFVQTMSTAANSMSSLNQMWPHFRDAIDYFREFSQNERSEAVSLTEQKSSWKKPISKAVPPTQVVAPVRGHKPPMVKAVRLTFKYNSRSKATVENLDLDIGPGNQLGILGPSGSGKSTLLNLMMGVLQPTSGEVRIDGFTPGEYFAGANPRIGYVGPEPFLIGGTIRDNLSYGLRENVCDSQCWDALNAAHLDDFVMSLPGRLNYLIPENGEGLSAGQKQRLSLARALLPNPELLFLDEASSNLDTATEMSLAETLFKRLHGRVTTIVISHRAEFLKYSDSLLKLEMLADDHSKVFNL